MEAPQGQFVMLLALSLTISRCISQSLIVLHYYISLSLAMYSCSYYVSLYLTGPQRSYHVVFSIALSEVLSSGPQDELEDEITNLQKENRCFLLCSAAPAEAFGAGCSDGSWIARQMRWRWPKSAKKQPFEVLVQH